MPRFEIHEARNGAFLGAVDASSPTDAVAKARGVLGPQCHPAHAGEIVARPVSLGAPCSADLADADVDLQSQEDDSAVQDFSGEETAPCRAIVPAPPVQV